MFQWILKKVFGTNHERQIKKLRPLVAKINDLQDRYKKLSDADLAAKTNAFKERIDNGESLDSMLPEAFAVCREASVRSLGMRHYDVQLIGGIVLHQGKIAEMKTGEGKTLVATLPCYLNALEGKGVHVVTVNDYLAKRDAEWMGKLHNFLGLEVGVVYGRQSDAEKKQAYRADITYGQNNEFGFDYLRDNMKFSIYDYAQRDLHYAIVDEVDSILIDEARTPLIISGPGEAASAKYGQIADLVARLRKDEHYAVDEKARSVAMTEDGIELAQRLLHSRGITELENLYDPVNLESLHILQQSLRAHALYLRDRDYMVGDDGKVLIIDEFTGRVLPGRRWSDGLHQAVEAKEKVSVQSENRTLATISFQNLFRLYGKLAGMTGTADTEAAEFHKTYELEVTVIPTNKPVVRQDHEDLVYKTEREKFRAVVAEIMDCHEAGQPVLVGTTSVEKSEALARMLKRRKVPFNVLNAKQHENEAYVVAQAGRKGSITVATNMAGRGTDIILGGNPEMLARQAILETRQQDPEAYPTQEDFEAAVIEAEGDFEERCGKEKEEVLSAGGLAIIGTERHESRRIDNQLRGRAGRQGDPGTSRFYLSLEDDLMRIFAGDRIQGMMDTLGMEEDVPIEHKWVSKAVENAQTKVEERNFDIRKHLLEYDDVMNQQRKSIYALRKQVLEGQYRRVPSEEDAKKGKEPELIVKEADPALRERAEPILKQMVQIHGFTEPFPEERTNEAIYEWRQRAYAVAIEDLGPLRADRLERDVYEWFGCRVPISRKMRKDAVATLEHLEDEVALSLTEQRERLYDMVASIIETIVERACPKNKHYEDWDFDGLAEAYQGQFGIDASGMDGGRFSDPDDLAKKLYDDAEAVLKKKEEEIGSESYLRLFRNFYLREIDRQWLQQLSNMEQLRDGIGLRGYGQRDPKKEYKKEGYDLFMGMIESVQGSVARSMFQLSVVSEEDIRRVEEQRRRDSERQQARMRAAHASASPSQGGEEAEGGEGQAGKGGKAGAQPAALPKQETVRRARPKVGRNDPCWCGSGKKYKRCHYNEDQAAGVAVG